MPRKQYTETDYISICENLNLEYVGFHKKGRRKYIDYICKKHMDKGISSSEVSHLKNYTYGCPYCSGRRKTNKDIAPLIKNKNVELISEYTGNEKPITCKCKECGNVWITQPKVLITNGSGCPVWGKRKASLKRRKTQEQFVSELKEANPNIDVIGEYCGTHKLIKCKCKIDGVVWETYPANLLNHTSGCPKCSKTLSESERHLLLTLDDLGISYKRQYPIDAGYKRPLRFDAYNEENKVAFEYNGEQHYYPIDFANRGKENAKEVLKAVQERDASKVQYCRDHGIILIVVPYWEKENMRSYIEERLPRKEYSKK